MLVGPSLCGKSSFAAKHFKAKEIVSLENCFKFVSDKENKLTAAKDAFEFLQSIVAKHLKAGELIVVDATNIQPQSRQLLVNLARKYHVNPVAIIFNLPMEICLERNKDRADGQFKNQEIRNQYDELQRSLKKVHNEGVNQIYVLNTVEEVDNVIIERAPLSNNLRNVRGPFDIIGDIHGCFMELQKLLIKLGYQVQYNEKYRVTHPEHRKLIFLGDLVDRGPNTPEVLRIVMDTVEAGIALCVIGNHDDKLNRKLQGHDVKVGQGLAASLAQLEPKSPEFKTKITKFLNGLVSHYVLDDGNLAVSHAGIKEEYIGRDSPRIHVFCMYGDVTGERDEYGLPIRYPWARDYHGNTCIVYGHTPVSKVEWINNTINIDTGCVFGGKLTALRYPEKEIISVQAEKIYFHSIKPLEDDVTESSLN